METAVIDSTPTLLIETGRQLGHDLYRYRSQVALRRLPPSLREGYDGASATGVRPIVADRFVRKWLQLRLGAWQRGRTFDEGVNPRLIEAMDVAICPVMRMPLTHGALTGSDWSVDRLNNDGAYAANNLAVVSTVANRAKGSLSFDDVLDRSRSSASSEGLTPVEWLRMAALMLGPCFASRPQDAPVLPLAAPIPLYSVRLAMQQVQHVFTLQAASPSGKNLLIKQFRHACGTERSEIRLRLLAEQVHAGLKQQRHPHDVWLREGVMAALLRWREALDPTAWARAGEISRALAGSRVVPTSRLQQWALGSRGYAC